jgi:hypothetical protein
MAREPEIKKTIFPRLQEESSAISLEPSAVLKSGAVSLKGSELTVKNADLAHLIQSKLANAATLVGARNVASDVDTGVTVKVHF